MLLFFIYCSHFSIIITACLMCLSRYKPTLIINKTFIAAAVYTAKFYIAIFNLESLN